MSTKKKMPYELGELEQTEDGLVAHVIFDSEEYKVLLTAEVLRYVLDGGFRTRISAAMAGKNSKGQPKGLKEGHIAAQRLVDGIVGRVNKKAEERKAQREAAVAKLREALSGQPEEIVEVAVEQMLAAMA